MMKGEIGVPQGIAKGPRGLQKCGKGLEEIMNKQSVVKEKLSLPE